MHWFYLPYIEGTNITLPETESKHCIKVLRLGVGEVIYATNGEGTVFEAKITDPNPKRTSAEIINEFVHYKKRPYKLHMAVAPTKLNERFEWFLEKATEIGIDEITPIECFHSERRKINSERYNKVLEAAMKQSYKAYHPVLNDLISFDKFVAQQEHVENKFIAHCLEGEKISFHKAFAAQKDVLVIIGPEGGFSMGEVAKAQSYGFGAVTLGESRLRTETAAIMACAAVAIINQ
jgi:16S rRNA (uracil1498-N3)-methyltransferase